MAAQSKIKFLHINHIIPKDYTSLPTSYDVCFIPDLFMSCIPLWFFVYEFLLISVWGLDMFINNAFGVA